VQHGADVGQPHRIDHEAVVFVNAVGDIGRLVAVQSLKVGVADTLASAEVTETAIGAVHVL